VITINEQKETKKQERTRNIALTFRVTAEEKALIEKRMEQSGITSMRAYLLKQAIDGRVIHVELDSVREMIRLLSNATSNINQIAKRVNTTGNLYAADVSDLQSRYDELWTQTREILRRLSEV
jgi:uncharacterized protein (DUF1778 family)